MPLEKDRGVNSCKKIRFKTPASALFPADSGVEDLLYDGDPPDVDVNKRKG